MRCCIFSLLICLSRVCAGGMSTYEQHVQRVRQSWDALIPTNFVMQYAGNMGLLSGGVGWDYGKNKQWETDLMIGFLPRYHSNSTKATLTLKENFTPWCVEMKPGKLDLQPLSCGIYLNSILGSDFWGSQPDRYPDNYYSHLSTKIRINAFIGQRLEWNVPDNRRKYAKSIIFFYELSTYDLRLRALFVGEGLGLKDIFSLSLGIRLRVF